MVGFLSLPLSWVSFTFSFYHVSFYQVGLLLFLVSTLLGSSWGCFSQVKSETQNQICPGSVKFPWFYLAAAKIWNGRLVLQLGYSSVLFGKQRKIHPQGLRAGQPKRRERPNLGSSSYFFFLPLSLPYVIWASQEGCLFHLRFSLHSSDFLLFHFCGLFPFFVF